MKLIRPLWKPIAVALGFVAVAFLPLAWGATGANAQAIQTLAAGTTMTGTITSRLGDRWLFTACAGDVVTVTMASIAFNPYLELFGAAGEDPLAASEPAADGATLAGIELAASGVYTLWVGGERRSDRGIYSLTLTTVVTPVTETVDGWLAYGATVTGTVRNRAGALWAFRGCAGDQITATMSSSAFTPYLELSIDGADEPLLIAEAGTENQAQLTGVTLTETHTYLLLTTGANRSDRGGYTLTLTGNGIMAAPPITPVAAIASVTPTPTALPVPTATATPSATPTPTTAPALCTVRMEGLNLRSGPGTIYEPPIGALSAGATLRMVARNGNNSWVQVEVIPGGQVGWVAAGAQYIQCSSPISLLPLGVIPPTPTPHPTPTLTPPPLAVLPGGFPGGGFAGAIFTSARDSRYDENEDKSIFTSQIDLRLEVYRTPNNQRIDHVLFTFGDENFAVVHEQRENDYAYCSFGGGVPNCNVLALRPGVTWPSTGLPIVAGTYDVEIGIFLAGDEEDNPSGSVFRTIEIATPGLGGSGGGTTGFTGNWYTNFADMTLQQNGDTVSGSYQRYGRNEALALNGTVSGRTLTGYFGDNPADQVTFTLSEDGNYLDGAWLYRADGQWRQWCGVRVGLGALPDGCGFSGDWFTISDYTPASPPTARLQQIGPRVTGTFFNGTSTGTLEGELGQAGPDPHHSLSGVYSVNGNRGAFRWDLLDFNSNQFAGCWANNEGAHEWCGWRAGGTQPAQCLPTSSCP
ncbi:MAG: SH3 domain-containing protein [Caldilinea sp. CFX5]|nr:SH3 domain-containing protein [Caldilinea sp. CFX5]